MKVTILEYQNERFAVIEEKYQPNDLLNIFKVDYLIFMEKKFYYDYKITTFNQNGECFCLSSLAIVSAYKKNERLQILYNQKSYEIFRNEKSTYLVIDAPLILNKYKSLEKYNCYFINFNGFYYLVSPYKLEDKEYKDIKKKRCFDKILVLNDMYANEDVSTYLIIKEYLENLWNLQREKKLNMKVFFQKNLVIEIKDVNFLYRGFR